MLFEVAPAQEYTEIEAETRDEPELLPDRTRPLERVSAEDVQDPGGQPDVAGQARSGGQPDRSRNDTGDGLRDAERAGLGVDQGLRAACSDIDRIYRPISGISYQFESCVNWRSEMGQFM